MSKGYTLDQVIEAIKKSGGVISTIANRLGCTWATARSYINRWETSKSAYDDEEQAILDMAESCIFGAIKDGDVQAAKWILSTKGKNRGYTDRHEVTGKDGDSIIIKIDPVSTDDTE